MNITTAAVAGTMCAGGGFQLLKDFCIAINMPIMSSATYQSHAVTLSPYWEKAALLEMEKAGEEEYELALNDSDVDDDGTPIVTVAADVSWPKRSFKSKYESLSGVAAIIGMRTGKCLYIGVRNKYCCICARATNKGQEPDEHLCYKNWDSSSTALESDIVVQGFLISEDLHRLRYGRLVADSDSSTYKRIREANPFRSIVVEKIECKNHVLRNLTGRLTHLSTPKRGQPSLGDTASRKLVGSQIANIRKGITMAIKYRKSQTDLALRERIQLLQKDIENAALHYFGDHEKCDSYFCTSAHDKILNFYSSHAKSLIYDMSSNFADQYNSIIAKFISGKRINWTQRNSYSDRCHMAVVSHNTHKTFYSLHKSMCDSSPGYHSKKIEETQKNNTIRAKKRPQEIKDTGMLIKRKKFTKRSTGPDRHYNLNTNKLPMSKLELKRACSQFITDLTRSADERAQIETDTKLQLASGGKWLALRRNFLTSSRFGEVCKPRPTTKIGRLVGSILNNCDDHNASRHDKNIRLSYGVNTEETAKAKLEEVLGV
ncbi:hypothetical protein B566_EDAN006202 [Ephemera danica]|nr:hypothetical protein B566_EDAN006202 [Ephemera danica]